MAQIGSTRFLERVEFFNGERLFAADLQTLEEFQREMRWLHNRSLHQPGVASGFTVAGEKGDRQVSVKPGYALDSSGREIVLTETNHTEAVPPVADDGAGNPVTFYLTVSYPVILQAQNQQAACPSDPPGAVRLSEVPVFCWVRAGATASASLLQQIEAGDRILLATALVLNCQLYQPVSMVQRRNAKPGVHPYIFSAHAGLPWVKGKVIFATTPNGIELQSATPKERSIDTSAAGFRTQPCYFANLLGERTIQLDATTQVTLEPLIGIASPSPTDFRVSLLISRVLTQGVQDFAKLPDQLNSLQDHGKLNWQIEWMGVEA